MSGAVDQGVAEAHEDQEDDADVSSTQVAVGLVSWDAAHERIEHERDVSSV